ncbi:hypothetical protein SeMB42_g00865 [Synchytrium endobioticum]|uniref:Secreted protein n=1 Tax=Synchytrium endobioticum TaxID=286115 RepID=A0A507DJ89_9FUNG|nr:hypothetical protein SeLEV6574_g00133 [Synchytrium endobioticum]TPX53283.1 hypothetical protein SeMB42_g00865 [Synchytrium endobioticum]
MSCFRWSIPYWLFFVAPSGSSHICESPQVADGHCNAWKPKTTLVLAESGITLQANFSRVGNHPVSIHTTMVVRQHDRFYTHRDSSRASRNGFVRPRDLGTVACKKNSLTLRRP